jgi:NADP-dependent alcohol dehydrogenase
MALNGLIGQGVPQDWSTHMIGHEFTALYGLDHAQTLAIVLPSLMRKQKTQKAEKIKQLGREVFKLSAESDEALIEQTIDATQAFFESMQVKTRISDYGLGRNAIDEVLAKLKENQRLKLGEHQDITLEVSKDILEMAYE